MYILTDFFYLEEEEKENSKANNSLFLTSAVFAYGDNFLNQLCTEKKNTCCNIIFSSNKQIKKLFVGSEFSYFINSDNEIYSFGWNEHFNLGNGNNKQSGELFKIEGFKTDFMLLGGAYSYLIKK